MPPNLANSNISKLLPYPILPVGWSCLVVNVAPDGIPVDKVVHELVLLVIFIFITIITTVTSPASTSSSPQSSPSSSPSSPLSPAHAYSTSLSWSASHQKENFRDRLHCQSGSCPVEHDDDDDADGDDDIDDNDDSLITFEYFLMSRWSSLMLSLLPPDVKSLPELIQILVACSTFIFRSKLLISSQFVLLHNVSHFYIFWNL